MQQVEQALHHAVVLELGLEARSDVIEFPSDLLIRRADDATAHPVPTGQSKLATFDSLDQASVKYETLLARTDSAVCRGCATRM